jgi:hypothetical protein
MTDKSNGGPKTFATNQDVYPLLLGEGQGEVLYVASGFMPDESNYIIPPNALSLQTATQIPTKIKIPPI